MTSDIPEYSVRTSFTSHFLGRCGLFLLDPQIMKVVGLTAAQLVKGDGIVEYAGKPIGQKSSVFSSKESGRLRPAHSMIEVIVFGKYFCKNSNNQELSFDRISEGVDLILNDVKDDNVVYIYNKSEKRTKAKILRSHSTFRMPCPKTNEMTQFYDAIELVSIKDDFISSHDVGSLVATDNNVPIGILICGDKTRAFLAPIEHVVSRIFGSMSSMPKVNFDKSTLHFAGNQIRYKKKEFNHEEIDRLLDLLATNNPTQADAKRLSKSVFAQKEDALSNE